MKNYNFKLVYKKYNKKTVKAKTIASIVFIILLTIIAGFYISGNLKILHILTNSSAPFHPADSLAIDYKVPFDELQVGDFITWSTDGGRNFITHQIVKIDKVNMTVTTSQQQFNLDSTKVLPIEEWDSNQFDSPKTENQYYGKVLFSIPKVGLYLTSIKNMIINNRSINLVGIVYISLIFLAYYLFSKIINQTTYILMGR